MAHKKTPRTLWGANLLEIDGSVSKMTQHASHTWMSIVYACWNICQTCSSLQRCQLHGHADCWGLLPRNLVEPHCLPPALRHGDSSPACHFRLHCKGLIKLLYIHSPAKYKSAPAAFSRTSQMLQIEWKLSIDHSMISSAQGSKACISAELACGTRSCQSTHALPNCCSCGFVTPGIHVAPSCKSGLPFLSVQPAEGTPGRHQLRV